MLIRALWESYRKDVVPMTASRTQILECKRAFYAGIAGIYGHLTCDQTDFPTFMPQLEKELTEFGNNPR